MSTTLIRIILTIYVSLWGYTVLGQNSIYYQKEKISPVESYVHTYKPRYFALVNRLEEDKSLNMGEKLSRYATELKSLKEKFKEERTKEYKEKEYKRARRVSCVGKHTRNITTCERVIIEAPDKNMYTLPDWITEEITEEITDRIKVLLVNEHRVEILSSSSGKRVNKGVVYVIFKYKEDKIEGLVEEESKELIRLLNLE